MHLYWFALFALPVTWATFGLQDYANNNGFLEKSEERARRSLSSMVKFGKLALKGVMARKEILFGSTKIKNYPSKGQNGAKQYWFGKPGSWIQAKQDFYAVHPTNVARGKLGLIQFGTIGDKTIELTYKGSFDLPAIKIFTVKTRGPEPQLITEEILYINRPTELGAYSYFDL